MNVVGPSLGCAAFPLVAAWLFAGCSGSGNQRTSDAQIVEREDPRTAVCASADAAGESAAPPFEIIQRIFSENCTSCHAHGADLDLTPGAAWGDLVGALAPVAEACGGTLVTAGAPDTSYLLQKISVDQPCSGMRMPRTEFAPDPLPDCVIALVRSWIAVGAPGPTNADAGAD